MGAFSGPGFDNTLTPCLGRTRGTPHIRRIAQTALEMTFGTWVILILTLRLCHSVPGDLLVHPRLGAAVGFHAPGLPQTTPQSLCFGSALRHLH
jgi:hypothetical protein